MIDLLINQLIQTIDNKSIEGKFKSIGWERDNGKGTLKKIDYNEFKKVVIIEIPELYKNDSESVETFIWINVNNFDLKILSSKVDQSKLYSYDGVNIYPLDDYKKLKRNKSPILEKIFRIYCKDEFGNIIKKDTNNYLDYLLLNTGDNTNEVLDNCSDDNAFNDTETNFITYLEYLITKNKLIHYPDNYEIYIPFYEIDYIKKINDNNILVYNPSLKLTNFISNNKFTNEDNKGNVIFTELTEIMELLNTMEYLNDIPIKKSITSKIETTLSNILTDIDQYILNLGESIELILRDHSTTKQIERLERYYNLKIKVKN